MKIAAIADIHGNDLALEAVLSDIARQSPDLIVNLGDSHLTHSGTKPTTTTVVKEEASPDRKRCK